MGPLNQNQVNKNLDMEITRNRISRRVLIPPIKSLGSFLGTLCL